MRYLAIMAVFCFMVSSLGAKTAPAHSAGVQVIKARKNKVKAHKPRHTVKRQSRRTR